MAQTRNAKDERMFTVELRSKGDVKNVSLDEDEKIVIEGSIGSFKRAQFVEDLVMEVIGSNGELRIDLTSMDLSHSVRPERPKNDRRSDR
ncbi:MAG: hypothetical protein ISF22_02770 [Methanomassiliicoccus sp.]|nr:hypothetical protein [Methanomassiliicoccus sp.]